jgi:hypothetical protein
MKLSAMLRPADTATKLTATRNLLAAAQARIERLQADRKAALAADSDDIEAVRRIDVQIVAERGSLDAYQDRIAVLEARIAAEQAKQAKRDHQAWIDKIEALLPKRARAAAELEAAIAAVGAAMRKYKDETAAIHAAWNPDLFFSLDVGHAGTVIQRAFQPTTWLRDPRTGRPPDRHQYVAAAIIAGEAAEGFAADVEQRHAALISDLRNPAPPDVDDDFAVETKQSEAEAVA